MNNSKSQLKRLCAQNPVGMAAEINKANQRIKELQEENERLNGMVAMHNFAQKEKQND